MSASASLAAPQPPWPDHGSYTRRPVTPLRAAADEWKAVFSPNASRAAGLLVELAARANASSSPGYLSTSAPALAPHGKLLAGVRPEMNAKAPGSPPAFSFMRFTTSPILAPAEGDALFDYETDEAESESEYGSSSTSLGTSLQKLDFSGTDCDTEAEGLSDGGDTDMDKTEDEAAGMRRAARAARKGISAVSSGRARKKKVTRRRFGSVRRRKSGARKNTV
ncbi:hypothetical protein DFJ74DRAFT_711445 [Hyaloraphidium curvatum]|nr:hypothetical protein DFJ74DRAFT_711445 [Hyaloraphidium curvatum]